MDYDSKGEKIVKVAEVFSKQNKERVYKHLLYGMLLAFASAFLIWKCKYGFGNIDESFYITVPYRLFRGDGLFLHEWHLSQMAGFLTWPIVSLYLLIKGSTAGIVLFLRYFCTLLQIATAIFIYVRLNKINWLGAALSSLSYVLYIPFGIMALSYNSMAIMTLVISTVIILTAQKLKHIQYIIAGVFYAAAVLCCPYLAIAFCLYAAVVIIAMIIRKLMKNAVEPQFYFFTAKGFVFLAIGAAVSAVIFAVFVFSRASLSEILEVFPKIMDDPEHPRISLLDVTKIFFTAILSANVLAKYIYPILIALFFVCLADRKRREHRLSYILIVLICVLTLMLGYYNINPYINNIMWSLNIPALFIVVLTKEKIIKNIFFTSWIAGMIYAFCLNATSNQMFYAISSASSVSLVGSIMIICIFVTELSKEEVVGELKNLVVILIGLVLVLQFFMQTSLRYKSVFWETDMASQKVLIKDGYNAGLYVTEEKYQQYYTRLNDVKKLEEYDAEKVLFLSNYTGYYLVGDYDMSTYSAWLSGVNEHSVKRLKTYFEINPDKKPDVVYAEKDFEEFAKQFCELCGYRIDRTDDFAIILVKN